MGCWWINESKCSMSLLFFCLFAGELSEVQCAVEGAHREDLWAGAGAGRDPHESGLVSVLFYVWTPKPHRNI